jgi:type I restriction enzyme S subunit
MNFRKNDRPMGWEWSTLEETCEIILGQSPPSKTYNTEGIGLPFYQGKAEFGDLYPTPVKWCSAPKKIAESGDILISVRAPVGPTNLCPEESCIGRGLAAIRPLGDIPNKYVLYYLRYIEHEWDDKATGTTFKAITGKILKTTELPLAPQSEQSLIVRKIEKLFSQLDAGLQDLNRVQANLARYKASLLKAACEGRLVPTEAERARAEGRYYERGEELLQRILAERKKKWEEEQRAAGKDPSRMKYKEPGPPDTEGLPELPEGWVWARVGQISHTIQYGTSEKANLDPSGIPVLRMGNIQDGNIDFGNLKYLSHETPKINGLLLDAGDILFNRTNSAELVGKTAVYKSTHPKATFASYLIRVRACDSYLPELVSYYINSFYGRKYIAAVVSQQVGQANVNGTKLANMPIIVPPLDEQIRVVAELERRFSIIEELETAVKANLTRAERVRQAILKRAFEGKLMQQKSNR